MSLDPDAASAEPVVEAVPVAPGTDAGTATGEDAQGDRNETITAAGEAPAHREHGA